MLVLAAGRLDGSCSVFLFFFERSAHHRDLHSFPTRRSSDLDDRTARRRRMGPRWPEAVHLERKHRGPHPGLRARAGNEPPRDRKSTRLNSSHRTISYAVFCLKKKKTQPPTTTEYTQTHTHPK